MRSAHGAEFVLPLVRNTQCHLEDELDIDCVADGRAIWPDAWSEFQRQQYIAQLAVVTAVRRRIEAEELRISLFVDVEVRREMISTQRRGRGERWKEELRRRRGIIGARTTTSSGPCSASRSGTDA